MRRSGLLMHISSLPNGYGIGKLGKESYEFADYLEKCGQSYWQILPLSTTSYGDSPYQSFSVFAGNPYFISLEALEEDGLLLPEEYKGIKWCDSDRYVDYGLLYKTLYPVLRCAYERFKENPTRGYNFYLTKNSGWLPDYALFMSLKDANGGKPWSEWDRPLRLREKAAIKEAAKKYSDDIGFWCFLQYEFYRQWGKLKKYVNKKGIEIIGDIPIYAAYDSADVWCNPELFLLDEDRAPTVVAGFPPDIFSPDGQLWGNPIYNWERMQEDGFKWWTERIAFAKSIYDIVRIDHFIGFDRYYSIPYGDKTARNGRWNKGPGYPLFKAIKEATGEGGIIAEDLGILTDSVRKLLKKTGYPGMKVLQFGFDPKADSEYLPQNFSSTNCVVYTGTHDNDTAAGWARSLDKKTLRFVKKYLSVKKKREIPAAMIRLAWLSTADTAITTMQDICGFGSEARINIPSTLGSNWTWRAVGSDFTAERAKKLRQLTRMANRIVKTESPAE